MPFDSPSQTLPAPTILDLFCGAGGLSLGFELAGFRVVGGVDNWAPAIETFKRAHPEASVLQRDLSIASSRDILRDLGVDGVDVVVGGPSCQGFSTSGGLSRSSGRDESDPRNQLFLSYLSMVEAAQPKWVVFENVPGLLLYNQGRFALEIVSAFKEIGYSVVPMILLAADYGVPQLRRRLFFVGNRTGQVIRFPAPTHGSAELWRDFSLPFAHLSRIGHSAAADTFPHVTFDEACSDLPRCAEGKSIHGVPYPGPAKSAYQELMRSGSALVTQHTSATLSTLDRYAAQNLRQGQNWRDLPKRVLPERFSRIRSYDATTMLKRLSGSRPAYTITTKFNEATTGAFIHPRQARTLTLREAARLQSFPDRLEFFGLPAAARQQIGNAVPPLLGKALAEGILDLVLKESYSTNVAPLRSTIEVDNSVTAEDILQLKGGKRVRTQSATATV